MGNHSQLKLPADPPAWLAQFDSASIASDRRQMATERRLGQLVDEYSRPTYDQVPLSDAKRMDLIGRLWRCLNYHGEVISRQRTISLEDVIGEVQTGKALGAQDSADGLADVTLAQALEAGENRAATMFEKEYMPLVGQTARRLAGQRGEEHVENFAAELIMPRADRPPRIAQYVGKTSFARWVRTVATNYCLSKFRAVREQQRFDEPQIANSNSSAVLIDSQPCLELVRPLVQEAVERLPAEDRLLLRWLTLDGVPQQHVAKVLGIHTGNVTRRRQKAAQDVLQHVNTAARHVGKQGTVTDCLDSLLTGGDAQGREQLGQWLAAALPAAEAEGVVEP